MTIHAIIWDIGGVLERTEDPTPRLKLSDRLGVGVTELAHFFFGHTDNFRVQLGEITPEEHWENVRTQLGLTEEEMIKAREEFFAGDRLDMDLVNSIRELKRDYCTAVLSNYTAVLRGRITAEWQIDDAFHHLIISAEVGLMKPDPGIFELALETIGCNPEEAVFIDDFIENVEGARNVGIHGILFPDPQQAITSLNEILSK
jgi:epoxide hydrolase-like predicted phosphatase